MTFKVYFEDPSVTGGSSYRTVSAEVGRNLKEGEGMPDGGFVELEDVSTGQRTWVMTSRLIKIEEQGAEPQQPPASAYSR